MDSANEIQNSLNKYNWNDLESICVEWNSSPYGTVNTYTKVQSAQNAAYIASSLIHLQYCKADKAYYYRGDDSSFGLFNNNPDPSNPSSKNVCTYAAQSFSLFARMFETPYILQQNNIFNTGIATLAAENETGDKINVLAANYKLDSAFTDGSQPSTETSLYKQYCLDTSRTVDQIIDQYGVNKWFGGIDPNTISCDNVVP